MGRNRQPGARREPPSQRNLVAPDASALAILRRYSTGEISAREAAKALGPTSSEHDVFAGLIAAGLPLPSPPPEQIAREVEALRALYGPQGGAAK